MWKVAQAGAPRSAARAHGLTHYTGVQQDLVAELRRQERQRGGGFPFTQLVGTIVLQALRRFRRCETLLYVRAELCRKCWNRLVMPARACVMRHWAALLSSRLWLPGSLSLGA